jgi:membrane-bound ClpP family serine protease
LIGWLICMVFYLTERRASEIKQSENSKDADVSQRLTRWMLSARSSFCLLAGILIAVAAYTAALRIPLPEVTPDITLACYQMVGLGLLLVGLSETPMQVGFGLLTFLSGFDLFYVALEPSLAVAGLLGAVSFLIALSTAYLRAAQIVAEEKGSVP